MGKKIILSKGQRFNNLTIIGVDHTEEYRSPNGRNLKKKYYKCLCDCGKETIVYQGKIISGQTKSCGCISKKHGMWDTRLYNIWRGMIKRCCLKTNRDYYRYGERGISIFEEWKKDFKLFYEWSIQNGYKEGLTIDRINNDEGYFPQNCRWATQKEQANNKRTNVFVYIDGEKKTIKEWSEKIGVPPWRMYQRKSRGKNLVEYIKGVMKSNG